jgi:ParB-like chromosome segregation protein Spo0J
VALRPADSPRIEGESGEHTRLLAETFEQLPPILVHRQTMRVIDGNHRLSAALLRGQDSIDVQYFDGTTRDAFVMAVRTNMAHGLPLSREDRGAAAARIISSHPEWSDRAIAASTGLAPRTVSRIRAELSADRAQPARRAGLDGRMRPVDATEGRIRASEIIAERPDASLREIARQAGISPTTAREVRALVRRGEDPRAPRERTPPAARAGGSAGRGKDRSAVNALVLLEGLRNDPQLRFTEAGREVLRWLASRAPGPAGLQDTVVKIPPHCGLLIAELARSLANDWARFADDLEGRVQELA